MEQILTDRQVVFLGLLAENQSLVDAVYLTGGTPLAAFYLGHRFSEDLDFFSEQEIDLLSIDVFLKSIQKKLGFKRIDSQTKMNRNLFFLEFGDEVLKTEFTYFPFPRIHKGAPHYGVMTDSLFDIAVNKLFSIYQRSVQRDYIDLYMICIRESYTIKDLIKNAKVKFDWHIDPFQLANQFLKAKEAVDPPRLITPLAPEEWHSFFQRETLNLKSEIMES